MYRIIASMLLCFSAVMVSAQNCIYQLKIYVIETHSFNPIYPATVYVENLNKSWYSNEEGIIKMDSLCAGEYRLHVVADGFLTTTDTLQITGNTTYKLKVDHNDHLLKEHEVTEERTKNAQQTKVVLNGKDIAAGSGKTLGDLLTAVNGVTTLTNGANIVKPVIHGMHSNRIVLVNNGIRQEDQQWGGEHAPNIDPSLANKITVIKGAAGVRYGTDAIGGVVLIEPAPLRTKTGWDGELNLSAFSNNRMGVASGLIEHNFKKIPALTVRVQGSLKKGGNYRIPNYWAANTGVNETNYSTTVGYRKLHYGAEVYYSHFNTSLGIYRGSHTGNNTDLMNAINSPYPLIPAQFTYSIARPRQQVSHNLLKAKLYADTRLGLWNATYGYQHNYREEYDVMRRDNGLAQLHLTLNTHTFNLNLDHKPKNGWSGQMGADAVYQDNYFKDGDRLFIPTYTSLGWAGYVIERYKKQNWTIESGIRFDYRSYSVDNPEGNNQQLVHYDFDFSNMSGTVGVKHQLRHNWQWGATLANAWRAPQASELFSAGLHHGAARIEIGNKNLLPERSYSLNLETKYTFQEKLTVDVLLYSQLIDHFIFLQPGPDLLTIRGYFKTFNYQQTNAWLNGTDVMVHYQWNSCLETSLKTSLLRARNRTANDWLILMPADRISFNARYTRDISLHLRECFVGMEPRYVWQQMRIPANFDSIDYPRPPQPYFLLDAALGARLIVGKQSIYMSLTVTNLLNEAYRDYLDVFRYFLNQPGTNAILRARLPIDFSKN